MAEKRVWIEVKRVWIDHDPADKFDPKTGSADVLVEMENGQLWQARFVTLPHLQQDLQLSLEVARDLNRALAPTPFLALETPHVIVHELSQDVIEDVVDNMLVLDVFESIFFQPEPKEAASREEIL
ncbi:MAG: hypothetical protein GYB65_08480 [Chloroflexi bacterium]|nr:hypothetical protein [Chloroflexota bacterium]